MCILGSIYKNYYLVIACVTLFLAMFLYTYYSHF